MMPLYEGPKCVGCKYLGSYIGNDYYYCRRQSVFTEVCGSPYMLHHNFFGPERAKKDIGSLFAYLMAKHKGMM